MNIAIFGGRFDPPHIWHFWSAQQILENEKDINQVWYMPDYGSAIKPVIASPSERVDMLNVMQTGRVRLSTLAVAKETTTYTIDMVRDLVKDPFNKYFWVVGSDITFEFPKWREYQKLSRLIQFLVIPRKDYPIKKLPPGFKKVEGNLMLSNVSSTLIRDRIKLGKTVKALVFPEVEEYIRRRSLYK